MVCGRLYAATYELNAVLQRKVDGTSQPLAHEEHLLSPATLAVGPDGSLYVVASQLHRLFFPPRDRSVALWVPLDVCRQDSWLSRADHPAIEVLGRVRAGVGSDQVRAEMDTERDWLRRDS